jgi:hypothetical protein
MLVFPSDAARHAVTAFGLPRARSLWIGDYPTSAFIECCSCADSKQDANADPEGKMAGHKVNNDPAGLNPMQGRPRRSCYA